MISEHALGLCFYIIVMTQKAEGNPYISQAELLVIEG